MGRRGWRSCHGFAVVSGEASGSLGEGMWSRSAGALDEVPSCASEAVTCRPSGRMTLRRFRIVSTTARFALSSSVVDWEPWAADCCCLARGSQGIGRTPFRAGWPYRRLPVLSHNQYEDHTQAQFCVLQYSAIPVCHRWLRLRETIST